MLGADTPKALPMTAVTVALELGDEAIVATPKVSSAATAIAILREYGRTEPAIVRSPPLKQRATFQRR
jgi:hypothetical protein